MQFWSEVKAAQLGWTLCDPMDSPWNSPGQNTGVDSLSLLQWIFPTHWLNPGLLQCTWILSQMSHQGSPCMCVCVCIYMCVVCVCVYVLCVCVLLYIKKQRHYFANKGLSSQSYGFSGGHVWMWELDYKGSWAPKNWCFWTVVLEKTFGSPLDCKEIQPVHPKGHSWVFIGRTDVEAEAPILGPPDLKSWLTGKDPEDGKDWRQEEKGATEDEIAGWHHQLNGSEPG